MEKTGDLFQSKKGFTEKNIEEIYGYINTVKGDIIRQFNEYIEHANRQMAKCQESVNATNAGFLKLEKTICDGLLTLQNRIDTFETQVKTALVNASFHGPVQ
jgi:hypothetical protein